MPWLEIGIAVGVIALIGGLITALVKSAKKKGALQNEVVHAGVNRKRTVKGAKIFGTRLTDDEFLSDLELPDDDK